MKTNVKTVILALAFAGAAASAAAQQFALRAETSLGAASKGPYDSIGGGVTLYGAYLLDPAGQNEISLSVGAFAWDESDVDRRRYTDGMTTTMWIDDKEFAIASNNSQFSFADGKMTLSDGSVYTTDYRPELAIVPIMANYRFLVGGPDDRVRFFVGGGAGLAELDMHSVLWRRFANDGGWRDDYRWSRHDNDSSWSFIWNATAGISIKIVRHWSIDASYAFQQVNGSTFHMRNVSYKLDKMNLSLARVGATWRF